MEEIMSEEDIKNYDTAIALNEATDDPETNPFKSKYEARKIFQAIRDLVHKQREGDGENKILCAMECSVEYRLGINYIYSEEVSAGEEKLNGLLELFVDEKRLEPRIMCILIATHNELSVIWSNREGGIEKAHGHLAKAQDLYLNYKANRDEAPFTIDDHFLVQKATELQRRNFFENLHTHTLYYLAQVCKHLGKSDESADYCLKTLRRQLNFQTYQPLEWALNCACLSQYFITNNKFFEARHCLACANFVIEEAKCKAEGDQEQRIQETMADIARCWVKYCLCLLEESKQKLSNDIGEIDQDLQRQASRNQGNKDMEEKSYERFALEVTSEEEKVSHELCCDFNQAKTAFVLGKRYAEDALKYFVIDGFVTDYIELHQDISRLYHFVAFFETSKEVKCRMHKRRLDILIPSLNELNPQYYLAICRQLQFEIAETYNEMLGLKLSIASAESAPSPHAAKKINSLCNSGIQYFQKFLHTCKTSDGKFPDRFEGDVERPALLAHFYLARFYSKLIVSTGSDKLRNMQQSLNDYSFITEYVDVNEEALDCVKAEIDICREMVALLPQSMERLRLAL